MTTTGEKHVYCASICAEERKPGKRQILDILKELVPEEQYAYIQKWQGTVASLWGFNNI